MLEITHISTSKYSNCLKLDPIACVNLIILVFVSITQSFAKSSDFSAGIANKVILIDRSEWGPPGTQKEKR